MAQRRSGRTERLSELSARGGRAVGVGPARARAAPRRGAGVHMIQEYARHNGNAYILRERVAGVTGS
ncbi:mycothiol transferase [Streptomyces cynarae]|uniref:mycothiol transferase n=1 Tax=Streptomyces cynarae TaxID=2981134 RepID=UPI00406CD987